MNEILKKTKVNVVMKDNGRIIFADSNLFLDGGRILIAQMFLGAASIPDKTKYVCDLGNDSTAPAPADTDLYGYISDASIQVTSGYPIALAGSLSGISFNFLYTNSGPDVTIKEIGLFYRSGSDNFPLRGTGYPGDRSGVGTLIARLRTTAQSIIVGSGRTITIDWNIIF